ncbi:MAG: choice-of-anchor B family protein, partial [Calditrichia bacterium]
MSSIVYSRLLSLKDVQRNFQRKLYMSAIILFISLVVSTAMAQDNSLVSLALESNLSIPGSSFITDVWGYYDSASGREYALITDNFLGLFIVDVTDPANPFIASQVSTVPGFDVKVWQHYVYTVNGGGNGQGGIVDISDPAHPQVVGSFPSSHNIIISDAGYMFAEFPGLKIYDLNPDPASPVLLWQKTTNDGHDATVVGNRLFDFHGYSGTFVYDIQNISAPQLQTTINDPAISYHHSGWVSPNGQFLYICDELAHHPGADITIWDIGNTGNPQRVGDFADPNAIVHNFIVRGNYAFVSYYTAGLRVFDISDPSTLSLVAEFDTAPQSSGENFRGAFGVYPFTNSGNIYVSDWDNGLFVFSFTDSNVTGIPPHGGNIPSDFALRQNYPNPFNPETTIVFEIPQATSVEIDIYNMLGQKIRTLISESLAEGTYPVKWDGKDAFQREVP